ncbi:unnamed protein product, partial [Staurois parvus]
CKRRQAGRVNINRAGRYRGSGREWFEVTSQGSEQEKSAEVRIKPGQQQDRDRTGTGAGCRNKIQGPGKTQHQGRVCRSAMSLKYTSIISSRCLTGCKVESLIAGSTRWPAPVLQLTRQVSPTIAGQSIPDSSITCYTGLL